MRKNSDEYDD